MLDVVPNHMAVPAPEHLARPLWEVLRDGPRSPYARWFDVDWAAQGDRLLLPVLGGPLEEVLPDLRVERDRAAGERVLRYHDHAFPCAPAPRSCRCARWSTPSGTGSPGGGRPAPS